MIKEIKSWFTQNKESGGRTFNFSAELFTTAIEYHLIQDLEKEIVKRIADLFLETHGEELKKDLLNDPNFADAVYNAIILKKAEKL